jgi:hypothetical protein
VEIPEKDAKALDQGHEDHVAVSEGNNQFGEAKYKTEKMTSKWQRMTQWMTQKK